MKKTTSNQNRRFWFGILVFAFVIGIAVVSCENGTTTETDPKKELGTITLVEQPNNSQYCGAACIKMAENYYFGQSYGFEYIFDKVSDISPTTRIRYNRTVKMGAYLEDRGVYTSIVRFSDLRKILDYCEGNQIPAIMNIQAVSDPLLGHFVVFAGYNSGTGIVGIKDPAARNRTSISYDNLRDSFIKVSPMAEIGDNIIIIASDRINIKREFLCGRCNKKNTVDGDILDAIADLICNNCDSLVSFR
jgi:ABC-type bacteriocin/lantibiotic exporter with double-glycine peptidase domain